tara:strand:+ start:2687 stop:3376 length:690 start_codon:yes stop_codon:yes gene_type:complete
MIIKTALILCAGFGKRLIPLTLEKPKPLLKLNDITILERCINLVSKLGIQKIYLNTFHLKDQINDFIMKKKFPIEIKIIEDGQKILDTGGGILNMINHTQDDNFIIFNPDTLWSEDYVDEIKGMHDFYFSQKLDNILLLSNKKISFDRNLKGDFKFKNNLLSKDGEKDFIYIGCQILNKDLFNGYKVSNFSVSEIWNELLKKNKLNGYESIKKFYHLTSLETFSKLKDF